MRWAATVVAGLALVLWGIILFAGVRFLYEGYEAGQNGAGHPDAGNGGLFLVIPIGMLAVVVRMWRRTNAGRSRWASLLVKSLFICFFGFMYVLVLEAGA